MLRPFFTIFFTFCSSMIFSQEKNSVDRREFDLPSSIYKNYYKADSLLKIIEKKYSEVNKLYYSGKSYSMGHYNVPEKQKSYPVSYCLTSLNERFVLDKELNYKGRSFRAKMTFLEDSCYFNDYGEEKTERGLLKGNEFSYFHLPQNILKMIGKNKASLHLVDINSDYYSLGFNNSFGNKFYISVHKKTNLIRSLIQLQYDELYGDSHKEIIYSAYKKSIPYQIVVRENNFMSKELHLDSISVEKAFLATSRKEEKISIDTLSDGLFVLKLRDYNNKVLVSEHKAFLAVYEAPISIKIGNEIVLFLNKKFKNKPIKYCFLSHHHPDHAGAVGVFARQNARIVTTKGNVSYFDKLSKSSHTLEQQVPLFKDSVDYIIIDSLGEKSFFKNSSTSVVVYESGVTSNHTKEFLFFYFPNEKILFVGDLVVFPKEKILDQRSRAWSVYQLIYAKKLNVEKIYTSWPLKKQKEFGTVMDLKNALLKYYPELK